MSSFYNCPYGWKMVYIDCTEPEQNFYSQFGLLGHNLLQEYFEEKLDKYDLANEYKNRFNIEITKDTPYSRSENLRDNYFEKGLYYFENFDLDLSDYNILGVELKVEFIIDGKEFIGFIDLLLQNKSTGDIIVLDHKSANYPLTKKGKVSAKHKKEYDLYKKQLYLYSKPIYEKFGRYPTELHWNYFKENKELKLPFIKEEYDDTIKWASDTIELIEKEELWLPNPEWYFCYNLCNCRNYACEYK